MPPPSKRHFPIPLSAAAVCLAGYLAFFRSQPPPPAPPPARSLETLFPLQEAGVLEPRLVERILTPISGTLAHVAEDGTRVAKGDLLFRLDEQEILSRIEQQQENIDQRQEELETAQNDLQIIVSSYEPLKLREEAELAHAGLVLATRLRGLKPEDRQRHELQIRLAELDVEDREDRLTRQRELVERNFAARSSLDSFERDLDAARAQLQERKTQYELEKQPLLEEERLSLEASVKQARDVVERSERRQAREVAGKELEIEGLELQITHAKQDMDDRKWELEQVRIYSPADGVIRLIRRQDRGSRTWETILVGRQTWGRDVLADLVDPNELTLRILVHESDILRIQPGQTARIRLTAYPESTLSGKVLSVTALGQDRADLTPIYRQAPPAMQAQFLAEISVDLGDVPARAGMTAFVAIDLGDTAP